MKPQSHQIKTIEDIVNLVTMDNADELADDLRSFLDHVVIAKGLLSAVNSITGNEAPITAADLGLKSLIWKPDGKRECHTTMQAKGHKKGDPSVHIKSAPTP